MSYGNGKRNGQRRGGRSNAQISSTGQRYCHPRYRQLTPRSEKLARDLRRSKGPLEPADISGLTTPVENGPLGVDNLPNGDEVVTWGERPNTGTGALVDVYEDPRLRAPEFRERMRRCGLIPDVMQWYTWLRKPVFEGGRGLGPRAALMCVTERFKDVNSPDEYAAMVERETEKRLWDVLFEAGKEREQERDEAGRGLPKTDEIFPWVVENLPKPLNQVEPLDVPSTGAVGWLKWAREKGTDDFYKKITDQSVRSQIKAAELKQAKADRVAAAGSGVDDELPYDDEDSGMGALAEAMRSVLGDDQASDGQTGQD